MSLLSLKTELRQELKLTPQLLQSMEILQMNSQELLEFLQRSAEENPVLEQEESPHLNSVYEELRQKASWIDGGIYAPSFSPADAAAEQGTLDPEMESLTAMDRLHFFAEPTSERTEFNLYSETEHFHIWLRLIYRHKDYNLRVHYYLK